MAGRWADLTKQPGASVDTGTWSDLAPMPPNATWTEEAAR